MTSQEPKYQHQNLPEVSLITSWHEPTTHETRHSFTAIKEALGEGLHLFDLYFLNHTDIQWYCHRLQIDHDQRPSEPHEFAASLTWDELKLLATELKRELRDSVRGALVGWIPRIVALATFFPNASLAEKNDDKRRTAVKALRNSLCLAHLLGCHCVEIVGGASVPGPTSQLEIDPTEHRNSRLSALARTIKNVFDIKETDNPLKEIGKLDHLPLLAIELEPGPAFLLNDLKAYKALRERIPKKMRNRIGLNIDIAHAFLIGVSPETIEKKYFKQVVHFHISDHAGKNGLGIHAADLCPGSFNLYDDFKPWLNLAIRLSSESRLFSGAIAVEMEARNDIEETCRAVRVTRRWLHKAGHQTAPASKKADLRCFREGALLVVDIGNSTGGLLKGVMSYATAPDLEAVVKLLFRPIIEHSGSIMSFTGDGFIAFFENPHFSDKTITACEAYAAAEALRNEFRNRREKDAPLISLRIALHWGKPYIPNAGPLQSQIIGGDVVMATRLCDWIAKEVEPKDETAYKMQWASIGATEDFRSLLKRGFQDKFVEKETKTPFKGIDSKHTRKVWIDSLLAAEGPKKIAKTHHPKTPKKKK